MPPGGPLRGRQRLHQALCGRPGGQASEGFRRGRRYDDRLPARRSFHAVKVFEARQAMADGATELDMVINIGQAIGGEWDAVASDIEAVTRIAHDGGAIVKVIFENCYLTDDQKVRLCQICGEVGADYVKTSTGYGTGGATHG